MTKKRRNTRQVQAIEVDATIVEEYKAKLPPGLLERMVIAKSPSGKILFIYDAPKPEYKVLARDKNGKILIRQIILEIPLITPE